MRRDDANELRKMTRPRTTTSYLTFLPYDFSMQFMDVYTVLYGSCMHRENRQTVAAARFGEKRAEPKKEKKGKNKHL
jgi:hypothetical protein